MPIDVPNYAKIEMDVVRPGQSDLGHADLLFHTTADPIGPSPSAFDAYSADAHTGGANGAMYDGSVVFVSDPIVVHDAQPLPVLMVIADGY
jgi:prepilin-type processing-associated H-X9-DG protein